ncbi:MAG: ABC transporter permease [Candidatus Hydrogenedentota bacterium]
MREPAEQERRTGAWRCLCRVVGRELGFIAHSPFCTLFIFILPVLSFGLLWGIFYHEVPRNLPIAVRDADESPLSRKLVRMTDASSLVAVATQVDDMEKGAATVRRGETYAVLNIPADFERDILRGEAAPVVLYYNNQSLLVSVLVSKSVREAVGTLSAGVDIKRRVAKGEHTAMAMEHYEPIVVDEHPLFNPNLNYRYFLLPLILAAMMQVFVIIMAVKAIGTELKLGTAAHWLATAGGRPWIALTGKQLPYTLCYVVLTAFMLALLVRYAGVPIYGNLTVLIVASLLFVLAYQNMGFVMVAVSANLRLANSLAGFYAGPAFAYTGVSFPIIGMPPAAKVFSALLPISHYLAVFVQQTLRGAPIEASYGPLLALVAFVVLPPIILMPRMHRLMRNPAYWGRI